MQLDSLTISALNMVMAFFFCLAYGLYSFRLKVYPGFFHWMAAMWCIALGLVVIVTQDARNVLHANIVAHWLMMAAVMLRVDALLRFLRNRRLNLWIYPVPFALCLVLFIPPLSPLSMYNGQQIFADSTVLIFLFVILGILFMPPHGDTRVLNYLAGFFIGLDCLFMVPHLGVRIFCPDDIPDSLAAFLTHLHVIPMVVEAGLGLSFLLMNSQRTDALLIRAFGELSESERRYRGLVESAFDGIVVSENGHVLEANPTLCRMFGWEPSEVVGVSVLEFVDREDHRLVQEKIMSQEAHTYEIRGRKRDGTIFPIEVQGRMSVNKSPGSRVAAIRDIGERKKLEQERRANERRLEAFSRLSITEFSSKDDLLNFALEECRKLSLSRAGYLHFFNPDGETLSFHKCSGPMAEASQINGISHHPLSQAGIWADSVRLGRAVIHNDYPGQKNKKGYPKGHFPVKRHMSVPIFDGRQIVGIIGMGNRETPYDGLDVKQLSIYANNMWQLYRQKGAEEELQRIHKSLASAHEALKRKNEDLQRLSSTDTLTGVLNRRAIMPLIEREMARLKRAGHPVSLMIFDLDHFKLINDRHGHATGDLVLSGVARAVTAVTRTTDAIARWGGEEFVVLVPDCDAQMAAAMAEKLRSVIRAIPFEKGLLVTASFGVASCRENESFQQWFERVDHALYRAKDGGRDRVALDR